MGGKPRPQINHRWAVIVVAHQRLAFVNENLLFGQLLAFADMVVAQSLGIVVAAKVTVVAAHSQHSAATADWVG